MRRKVINGVAYVTVTGAARLVGIHRNTMRELVDNGTIPTARFGTTFLYIREDDVTRFMERGAGAFDASAA